MNVRKVSVLLVALSIAIFGGLVLANGNHQDKNDNKTTEKVAKVENLKPSENDNTQVEGASTNIEQSSNSGSQNSTSSRTPKAAMSVTAASSTTSTTNQTQQTEQIAQNTGDNTETPPTTPPTNTETGTNNTSDEEETTPPAEEESDFDPTTDILEVPVGGNSASVTLSSADGADLYWSPGTAAFSFSDDVTPAEKPGAPEFLVVEYPESEGVVHVGSSVTFHVHGTENSVASDDILQTWIIIGDWQNGEDPMFVTIYYTVVDSVEN